ncbi:uncharacterized protein SCHCODRAFT_02487535 [Schizophyllum commune H4-8]|uniref:uncharacterized protein n=1 Tax=Schizophyllum commune (strain H4-8 / FGSC 9210) TaxID=578458 RepID=UPI00215DF002|nr:uncharacterized protein SCHCODRAFT_02487535 [Schizophyllum commune H4-8]KAI5898891.1 hypothetical protein SCHCODRAFT_02487535 [Schizophyllum commune H4-8]
MLSISCSHCSTLRPAVTRLRVNIVRWAREPRNIIDSLSITLTASNKHKRTLPSRPWSVHPSVDGPLDSLAYYRPSLTLLRSQQERQPGDEDSAHTLTIHSSSPIAIRLINRQASDHPTSGSPHAFRLSTSIADGRRILLRCCLLAVGFTGRGIQNRSEPDEVLGVIEVRKYVDFLRLPSRRRHARGYYSEGRDIMRYKTQLPMRWADSREAGHTMGDRPLRDTSPLRCLHAPPLLLWGGETMPVKYIDSGPFRHRAYVADAMQAGRPGLSNPLLTIAHRNLNVEHIVQDYISRIASNFSFD